jgi:hypothetical protein
MMDKWKYMTQSDADSLQIAGWNLVALNVTLVAVPPPSARIDFEAPTEDDYTHLGGMKIIETKRARRIDQDTHNALLDESLREYGDIWRRLAQR